ncbi:MAG TPA: GNVR domain-containing protein [Pyrinomonadaceae bacterium]|jgi:polysaccharide chain length determinant protein (PEP-CTERM system associated)|nr:GNVR domain-containing protein [Pyrinomonadaceae bacterium]
MSVEFRQRTPGEYARIIWKRKWLITLPTIAIATAVAIVVLRLPNVYESVTLIVVKPSTISTSVVPTVSDDTLTRQLNNINQVVTSRSSLQPLVERYGLYQQERARNEPMESIIDNMRKDIHVEVNTSRNDITNGFNITYRGRDPRTTQAVTAELATKFIDAQTKAAVTTSTQTKQFFEQQLAQVKQELDDIDKKRLEYMQQHMDNLPSQVGALLSQLTGLREQQKALISELGRLHDSRTALSTQLNALQQQFEIDKAEVAEIRTNVKETPAYGQLVQRKVALEAEIQNMLTTLRPQNPDVKAKQAELDSTLREMNRMVEDAEARNREIRERIDSRPDLRISGLNSDIQRVDNEIKRQEAALAQSEVQINELNGRINGVPGAEVALEVLNREYMTKKGNYDDLLKKSNDAELVANVQVNQQGETIQVIDPANLPSRPVAPKRPFLMMLGLGLGLAVGFFLAAAFEVPRLLTIQTTEDAEHYTGLPVLVSVPELLTPQEARRIPMRRRLVLAAGVVATLVSIPALALALRASHIFDRFLG